MGIAVYPRLGELLRSRDVSIAELERRIESRFGLSVNIKTLYRLASPEPVQRADLEIAGAVASVLGVGLGDLFDVQAIPTSDNAETEQILDPSESHRMSELFGRQSRAELSRSESDELDQLVSLYGRRLHEKHVREYAQQTGMTLDEAEREVASKLDEAMAWWRAFEADPEGRSALERRMRERQANHP